MGWPATDWIQWAKVMTAAMLGRPRVRWRRRGAGTTGVGGERWGPDVKKTPGRRGFDCGMECIAMHGPGEVQATKVGNQSPATMSPCGQDDSTLTVRRPRTRSTTSWSVTFRAQYGLLWGSAGLADSRLRAGGERGMKCYPLTRCTGS